MAELSSLSDSPVDAPQQIAGRRVGFLGRLVSMSRREAQDLIRERGGIALDRVDTHLDLVVIGDHGLPFDSRTGAELFDADVREAVDRGTIEVIGESQLWERLGLVEHHRSIHRLYTPALLAKLLQVPVAVIRRWHRRGLIVPARQVRKLPYFDFREVATARRLAELLAAGMTPTAIERKLETLARHLPDVTRPLAQLSVIVEGREILLRQGDGLIEPGGQLRLDFEAAPLFQTANAAVDKPDQDDGTSDDAGLANSAAAAAGRSNLSRAMSAHELLRLASELEDDGELARAAEMYRASLAAGGPHPETCFRLGELLYRMGELGAARERYYQVIELDDDFVEARANLGCVLMEQGDYELAEAAFEGALAYHGEYPDAHYHLARLLDEQGRHHEAIAHWKSFLRLSPTSPWAEEADERVNEP